MKLINEETKLKKRNEWKIYKFMILIIQCLVEESWINNEEAKLEKKNEWKLDKIMVSIN